MQRHIAGLFIVAFLSGCASPHQANNDNFAQKKAAEEASWAKLEKLSADKCDAGVQPPERGHAVELSMCVTRLVKEYVLPSAAFPDLLLSSREDALRIAEDYADGKISPEEYKRRSEDRLKSYSDSVIYFANQRMPPDIG